MFARILARPAFKVAQRTVGVRNMGHHHHPVPTEGIEGAVRKVLKTDEQLVLGILGMYGSIILLVNLMSGGKKEEVAAPVVEATPVAVEATIVKSDEPKGDFDEILELMPDIVAMFKELN